MVTAKAHICKVGQVVQCSKAAGNVKRLETVLALFIVVSTGVYHVV